MKNKKPRNLLISSNNIPYKMTIDQYFNELQIKNSQITPGELLSLPPVLTLLTLPYKELLNEKGKKALFYQKSVVKNKTIYNLAIETGIKTRINAQGEKEACYDEDGNYEIYGIPYGSYARLLLYHICSEVIKTKKKIIPLGNNFNEIFKKLKIRNSNHIDSISINLLKEQMDRLFNAKVYLAARTIDKTKGFYKKEESDSSLNFLKSIKKVEFWKEQDKDNDHQNNNQESKTASYNYEIEITDDFYNMIVSYNSVVFDYDIIPKLKRSPLALDLALHLNHWAYNATRWNRDLNISFDDLFQQFGTQVKNLNDKNVKKDFKKFIKSGLDKVLEVMPNLIISMTSKGFILHAGSLTSVPFKFETIENLKNQKKALAIEQELKALKDEQDQLAGSVLQQLLEKNINNKLEIDLDDQIPEFNDDADETSN